MTERADQREGPMMPGVEVEHLDHVAISVADRDEFTRAVHLFENVLGGEFVMGGDDLRRGMRSIQFSFPGRFKVEVLAPLSEDSKLARSIASRGPGLHHLTFLVADISHTVNMLERSGFETTDSDLDNKVWKETYIRPACAFQSLIQFAETTRDPARRFPQFSSDDVLAGRVIWNEEEEPEWRPRSDADEPPMTNRSGR